MILQKLLGEISAEKFLAEHFFRTPFALPGGCRELIDWDAAKTCERLLPQPDLDLLVTREGRPWPGPAVNTPELGKQLLAEGYTLCIRHADRHDPVLAELAAAFHRDFLAPIDVHVYCTPAERPGFSWHYDAEEVFILQTEGTKDWWLRKNTVNPWPLVETIPTDMRYGREIMPALQCTLAAGDWLYIPAGYWHRTSATAQSTSLSVGILSPSGMDVFDFLRSQLRDDLRWRQRLPVLGSANEKTEEELKAELAAHFTELAADLQKQLTSKTLPGRFLASRQQATNDDLPANTNTTKRIDREELIAWIRQGPIRITMNNGEIVEIPNRETALVSSTLATVLKMDSDGKYRHRLYPLEEMSKVELIDPAS